MARETKIGMVVGIGFIVCFAIVLSHRGQLTGVKDSSGFNIESLVGDGPSQTDTDKIRRSARRIGDTQPPDAPRRQRRYAENRDDRETGESGRSSGVVHVGNRARTRGDGRVTRESAAMASNQTPDRSEAESNDSRRFADVPIPAEHMPPMSGTTQSPGRFGSRRQPIQAKTQQDQKSRVVDLEAPTTNQPAPGRTVNGPKPEKLASRTTPDQSMHQSASRFGQTTSQDRAAPRNQARRAGENGAPVARIASHNRVATSTLSTEELRERIENDSTPAQHASRRLIGQHLIEPGDTLVRIARRYYQSDDPAVVQAIFEANRDRLKSPDHIVTNRRLRLPAVDQAPADAPGRHHPRRISDEPHPKSTGKKPSVNSPPPPPRNAKQYYKIQSGDTLGHIAQKHYGTARTEVLATIQKANPKAIPSLDRVIEGRKIELPQIAGIDFSGIETAVADATQPGESLYHAREARTKRQSNQEEGADAPQSAESSGKWRWYELKKGDLYSTVASRLLGSSARWTELAEINRDIFPDPDHIRHGVRIRLPVDDEMIATTGLRKG